VSRTAFVWFLSGGVILTLLSAGPLTAQQEPTLRFAGGDAAKTVQLKREKRGSVASGTLVLTVVNVTSASGALDLEFESTGDRTTITTDPPDPTIRSRRPARVDVSFRVFAGDDGVPDLSGSLTAAFHDEQGVGPALAELTGTSPTTATFVNKSVEFTVTDYWGPLRWLDRREESPAVTGHQDVSLRNAQALNDNPAASTRLTGSGDEIDLLLRPPRGAGNDLWRARLDVDDVEHAGEYKGTLSLDPATKGASELGATVKVTDFPAWPIAAIVLGAGVAWLLRVYFYERVLVRARLRKSLQAAVERYDRVAPKAPRGVTNLERWLGAPGDERRYDCDSKALPFAEAYCAAGGAKGHEALEAARKAIEGLVKGIDRWISLVAALQGLDEVGKKLPPPAELHPRKGESRIQRDSEVLLSGPLEIGSDQAVTKFEARVKSQTAVVTYFVATWRARKELEELLGRAKPRQDGDARKALRECDPRAIYDHAKPEHDRTPEESDALLGQLDHSARTLRWHRDNLAPQEGDRPGEWAATTEATAQPDAPFDALIEDLASKGEADVEAVKQVVRKTATERKPAKRRPVPSSAQLAAGIRVHEWLVFGAVTLVTAVVYFATTFAGRPFGTLTDYAVAFGAGFLGKVTLDRVPGFSSPPNEAADADPAGDGGDERA
jgi:hypothetical protein